MVSTARTRTQCLLMMLCSLSSAFTPSLPKAATSCASSPCRPATLLQMTADASSSAQSPRLLVTFDLDDTLFPIQPVVAAANAVLLQELHQHAPTWLDNTNNNNNNDPLFGMTEYLQRTKTIRTQILPTKLTYRGLRERTIRSILPPDQTNRVAACYAQWERMRNEAANDHVFDAAIPMLQALRQHNATILAITNGAGTPLRMPKIADYFDACISGEDDYDLDGTHAGPRRKPDAYIFERALRACGGDDDQDDLCWIHVGDCLVNDVAASAKCGAKAIWMAGKEEAAQNTGYSWSTATPEEIAERDEKRRHAQKYITSTIHCLSELPKEVQNIVRSSGQ